MDVAKKLTSNTKGRMVNAKKKINQKNCKKNFKKKTAKPNLQINLLDISRCHFSFIHSFHIFYFPFLFYSLIDISWRSSGSPNIYFIIEWIPRMAVKWHTHIFISYLYIIFLRWVKNKTIKKKILTETANRFHKTLNLLFFEWYFVFVTFFRGNINY